jgi:hypothetical protein
MVNNKKIFRIIYAKTNKLKNSIKYPPISISFYLFETVYEENCLK